MVTHPPGTSATLTRALLARPVFLIVPARAIAFEAMRNSVRFAALRLDNVDLRRVGRVMDNLLVVGWMGEGRMGLGMLVDPRWHLSLIRSMVVLH